MVFEKCRKIKEKTRLEVVFLFILFVIEVTPVGAECAVVQPGVKGRTAVKLKSRRSSRHLSWERGGFMINSAMSEMQFLRAENINLKKWFKITNWPYPGLNLHDSAPFKNIFSQQIASLTF